MPFSVIVGNRPNGQQAFTRPLARDTSFLTFWSAPARELSLPLMGRIYDEGLTVSDGDLDKLASELSRLERSGPQCRLNWNLLWNGRRPLATARPRRALFLWEIICVTTRHI